jgi:hypothetical protein
MRKIVLTVVATCAVVAFIPASALAHGHRHHHHARIHHRTFGHDWSQSGATTSNNPSSEQPAGTVASFTNGVLTITLSSNGQPFSGQVTPDTEIECQAAEPATMQSHESGDDNGGGGDNNNDQGDDDQGQGDDENNNPQNCDTSALTPGTVVQEARVTVSGAGVTFDKIELVTTSTSTSSGDD